MGDGVVEGDAAIQVRLPIEIEKKVVLVPTALGEDVLQGVRNSAGLRRLWRLIGVGAVLGRILEDGLHNFHGGVNNQGMPEVARNGFVALFAFAADGGFDGRGDAMRCLMEQDF